MLSPRLTNCPECANIPSLLKKIDCRLAELGNNLYNNISYMLNKPVPSDDILQLIGYRRILMYKYCNPNYVAKYSVPMIASRVIRLTAGCVSKCNEPEPCLEDPCDITIVPNPTTTSTSTIAPSTTTTSTTVVPSTTTTTTTVTSTQWIMFASFNPYSACQQIDGENVTIYTSTPFLGNGVTLYLDEALTIPYVSNPFTNNVLSDGVNQYFLGDYGGAVIVNSSSCQGFTTTTTSSSSTSTSTSTTTSTTTIPEGLERITFIGTESTFVLQGSPITNPDFTNYPSTLLQYGSSYSDGVNLGIIQSSYILNNEWSNYSDYEVTFIISETTYGPYRYQYNAPSIGFVDVPHGCFNVNGPTNVGVTFAVQVSFFDDDGTDLTSIINLLSVGDYIKVTKTKLL